MSGPTINKSGSRQDYGTPPEFIEAVEKRFGSIDYDLAANETNHVAEDWFGPGGDEPDSLVVDWSKLRGVLWCNPPFNATAKFIQKAALELRHRRGLSLFLTPTSSGANWFKICEENGFVLQLEDRIRFVGETHPYPKDLTLTVFGHNFVGRSRWHWDESKTKAYDRVLRPRKRAKKPAPELDAVIVTEAAE